jgi:hypothetical protein
LSQNCGEGSSKAFILRSDAYSRVAALNLKVVLGLGWHLVLPIRFRMAPIEIHSPRLSSACMEELKEHLMVLPNLDENSSPGRRPKPCQAGLGRLRPSTGAFLIK